MYTGEDKRLQDYVNQLKADFETDDDDEIIKYVLTTMIALEDVLEKTTKNNDPTDFITGVLDGSIVIVIEKKVPRPDYNDRFAKKEKV